MLPTLEDALVGQKIGSRVLAVIPPADGLGTNGAQEGIGANDTLVFVVDMTSTFSLTSVPGTPTSDGGGALPTVTEPAAGSTAGPTITIDTAATPPATLQVDTLIKGTGPVVQKGDDIAVQYTGYIWRTGKSFQSSWTDGQGAYSTEIGEGQTIPGWDTGLVGQTVGSQVLLSIPPADGYGSRRQLPGGHQGHRHPRVRHRHPRCFLARLTALQEGPVFPTCRDVIQWHVTEGPSELDRRPSPAR